MSPALVAIAAFALISCTPAKQPGVQETIRLAQEPNSGVQQTTGVTPPASRLPTPAKAPPASRLSLPAIVSLTPDSVVRAGGAIVEVLIRGKGFEPGEPGRNTVKIGPVVLTSMAANAAGTEIRFVIPERFSDGGEAPPRPVTPGDYVVTVRTRSGVSNGMKVRVVE